MACIIQAVIAVKKRSAGVWHTDGRDFFFRKPH